MTKTTIIFGFGLNVMACSTSHAQSGQAAPSTKASAAPAVPTVEVVAVTSKPLNTVTHLEGELTPYERVAIFARASGFVSNVLVDRGSHVKKGQLLLTLVAPELNAQRAEAQAKLSGDKATFDRLNAASQTPGAVSGNEVETAQAVVQSDKARLDSVRAMEQYLSVTAPFSGVITERDVHPGALVGPSGSGNSAPLLRLEEIQRLRLTVPVPEGLVGAMTEGTPTTFTVRAFPGVKFKGIVKRTAQSVDTKTRSMPVELDIDNTDARLASGMFADVLWAVKRPAPSLFVPATAVVQSTERTYVLRVASGLVEQVPIQRGETQGELLEVFGELKQGDSVTRRGSEELRSGMHVNIRSSQPSVPPP